MLIKWNKTTFNTNYKTNYKINDSGWYMNKSIGGWHLGAGAPLASWRDHADWKWIV